MLETLRLSDESSCSNDSELTDGLQAYSEPVQCLLCCESYHVEDDRDAFLKHLVVEHNLVIADVKLIADFKRSVQCAFF